MCIAVRRQRPAGWFGTSRHLTGDNMQQVQNQLRRSLNYHNVILNFIYKQLWRLIVGRFNCGRQQLQMTTDVFSTFILVLYLQVCSVIVLAVISASVPRQNLSSLCACAFLSSCRSLCLKGSSFILTCEMLPCQKLHIHTKLKSSAQCLQYADM